LLSFAQLCSALLSLAQLCSALLSFAQLCSALLSLAQLCSALLSFAQLCSALLSFAQLCSALLSFVSFFGICLCSDISFLQTNYSVITEHVGETIPPLPYLKSSDGRCFVTGPALFMYMGTYGSEASASATFSNFVKKHVILEPRCPLEFSIGRVDLSFQYQKTGRGSGLINALTVAGVEYVLQHYKGDGIQNKRDQLLTLVKGWKQHESTLGERPLDFTGDARQIYQFQRPIGDQIPLGMQLVLSAISGMANINTPAMEQMIRFRQTDLDITIAETQKENAMAARLQAELQIKKESQAIELQGQKDKDAAELQARKDRDAAELQAQKDVLQIKKEKDAAELQAQKEALQTQKDALQIKKDKDAAELQALKEALQAKKERDAADLQLKRDLNAIKLQIQRDAFEQKLDFERKRRQAQSELSERTLRKRSSVQGESPREATPPPPVRVARLNTPMAQYNALMVDTGGEAADFIQQQLCFDKEKAGSGGHGASMTGSGGGGASMVGSGGCGASMAGSGGVDTSLETESDDEHPEDVQPFVEHPTSLHADGRKQSDEQSVSSPADGGGA
jgi:hypothetical protein